MITFNEMSAEEKWVLCRRLAGSQNCSPKLRNDQASSRWFSITTACKLSPSAYQ
jgi:hypothetical protein